MSYNESLLFYLLRIGLGTESNYGFEFTEKPDWKFIFKMSSEQGILAIVFDGLNYIINKAKIKVDFIPSHTAKMMWGMNVIKIEDTYDTQYRLGKELADIYSENSLKMVVMKGIAASVLYPKPNHRPCGDVDCFLMGDYDKGNSIVERMGINLDKSFYKHAVFMYKDLMVENHKVLTNIKGPKRNKSFELALQKILYECYLEPINDTKLLSPSPLFNAIFLTVHAWQHFLPGELGLRHICDWAMLMKHHCNDIDWKRFVEVINIRDTKMIEFARCVSYIANHYMGVPMSPIFADCKYPDDTAERMLRYILYDYKTDSTHSPHYWRRKYYIMKDRLCGNWKYKAFSDQSNFRTFFNLFYDRWCEKHPHL